MAHPFTFPIIILAAGQSSRMRGRDKLMEVVDGAPLLRRQAAMARGVTSGEVIVALPVAPHPRYGVLEGLHVTTLPVPHAQEGMNASLRAAFAALPEDAPCAMLLLADLPELQAGDLMRVADATRLGGDTLIWRGATQDGAPGHPVVFAASLFPAFSVLTGDNGGRDIVASAKDRTVLVRLPGNRARRDLDTPEDWAAWRAERCQP